MKKRSIKRRSSSKRVKITRRDYRFLPIKFNRRIRNIIYEGLRARIPMKRVAQLAGIDYSTFNRWKRRGQDPNKYPVHACFVRKIQRIQIDHEREALAIIRRVAAGGDEITEKKVVMNGLGEVVETVSVVKTKASVWQAAAWWLERRFQEDYSLNRDEYDTKTAEETAAEIKQAADQMFDSVPVRE